ALAPARESLVASALVGRERLVRVALHADAALEHRPHSVARGAVAGVARLLVDLVGAERVLRRADALLVGTGLEEAPELVVLLAERVVEGEGLGVVLRGAAPRPVHRGGADARV